VGADGEVENMSEPDDADHAALFHTVALVPLAPGRWRLHAEERAYVATVIDATPEAITLGARWAEAQGVPRAAA
jgi:hypothetical protein